MNRREKVLGSGVLIVVIIAIAVQFMPEDGSLFAGFGGGGVSASRNAFLSNRLVLEQGPAIRAAYRRVEAQFPEVVGNRTAASTFSEELDKLFKQNGIKQPNLNQPEESEINGADEYYFIDIEIDLIGQLEDMISILLEIRKKGVLIQSLKLGRGKREFNEIRLKIVVSRLAEREKSTENNPKKRRGRKRG